MNEMPPREPTWDERILATTPSGVDRTQLVENLRLSPDERVAKLIAALDFVDALREARRAR